MAGHDTASAVAAVPARDKHFAYLSSGTWSLMGIEAPHAIINDKSYTLNFTNEGGIEGTTRFLKNICGMWLYERCRLEWPELKHLGHAELQKEAIALPGTESIIAPDDPVFANPESIVGAIPKATPRLSVAFLSLWLSVIKKSLAISKNLHHLISMCSTLLAEVPVMRSLTSLPPMLAV